MTLYLTRELKSIFNKLIDFDCLTNILLYSKETNGKTLTAKYIANQYYKNVYENLKDKDSENVDYERLYLNLSVSLYTNNKLKERIEGYIKKKEIVKCKKIIILDDYYYVNKALTSYLIQLISMVSDNVVFIIIVQDISTVNELIKSRCLIFNIDGLNQQFYKQVINDQYPSVSNENIERLKICFNNSIYTITTFLYYIDYYLEDIQNINERITQLLNIDLFDDNKSIIEELVDLTIKKNIKEVLKIIKRFYVKGYYSDNLLNNILNYTLYSKIEDKYKIIIIEEVLKSLHNIYKFTDSYLQVSKCFIKITEKLED